MDYQQTDKHNLQHSDHFHEIVLIGSPEAAAYSNTFNCKSNSKSEMQSRMETEASWVQR